MRLYSWNVNGIRALFKKGAWEWFYKERPDILCVQETKASADQLPDKLRRLDGYHAFFSSHEEKKGYSGVALYTKSEPKSVSYGMGVKRFDDEGRIIQAEYDDFILLNVYFPNGGQGPHRLSYKLDFYDAFLKHIESLRSDGKSIIFCGDINTAHEEVDLARPKANEKNTGFLPEERAWLDELVGLGYVDTFRHTHPNQANRYSYWDMKSRARDRNVGWRIDYFFTSPDLLPRIKKADILDTVMGSDHCPILLELK